MSQDRAQLLITAVDQTRSAFDSIRGNLAKLGDESNRVKGLKRVPLEVGFHPQAI